MAKPFVIYYFRCEDENCIECTDTYIPAESASILRKWCKANRWKVGKKVYCEKHAIISNKK